MNDTTPVPPIIPSKIPPVASSGEPRPLGDDPSERVPITNVIAAIDAILRHPRRVMFQLHHPEAGKLIVRLLLVSVVCSLIYGVVVGTFSGGAQLWIAPAKICDRTDDFGTDLPAEPLYLHLFKRLASATDSKFAGCWRDCSC